MTDINNYKTTKHNFRNLVYLKTKHITSKNHIFNVVNILLDELNKELYEKKSKIRIKNFCTIQILKNNPKKYWSVVDKKVKTSHGNYKVCFTVLPSIRKIVYKNIDIESL